MRIFRALKDLPRVRHRLQRSGCGILHTHMHHLLAHCRGPWVDHGSDCQQPPVEGWSGWKTSKNFAWVQPWRLIIVKYPLEGGIHLPRKFQCMLVCPHGQSTMQRNIQIGTERWCTLWNVSITYHPPFIHFEESSLLGSFMSCRSIHCHSRRNKAQWTSSLLAYNLYTIYVYIYIYISHILKSLTLMHNRNTLKGKVTATSTHNKITTSPSWHIPTNNRQVDVPDRVETNTLLLLQSFRQTGASMLFAFFFVMFAALITSLGCWTFSCRGCWPLTLSACSGRGSDCFGWSIMSRLRSRPGVVLSVCGCQGSAFRFRSTTLLADSHESTILGGCPTPWL